MIALPVPAPHTETAWPLIERWVTAALKRAKATTTPQKVREQLADRLMQLWIAWDPEKNRGHGCCITEISGETCYLVVTGGIQFRRWQKLTGTIKDWAREQGCTRLEASGRAGWERMAKADGWRKIRTTIEMEL